MRRSFKRFYNGERNPNKFDIYYYKATKLSYFPPI